jgi:hypothetical protein
MSLTGLKRLVIGGALALLASSAIAGAVSTATTTAVQVAAASAVSGRVTHVRAYSLVAAGATTVKFEYGTQVTNPCDTGTTALTGAMTMASGTPLTVAAPIDLFLAPSGDQLCIVQTGSVQLSGFVTYVQF